MSQIRRQSIISTFFVYAGFFIGFINTYLFTKQGFFTEGEYGLTMFFIAVGNIIFSVSNMGMIAYVYKFFPYYQDNLDKKKNDLLSWALLVCCIGFTLALVLGYFLKGIFIEKFGNNSPLTVKYYFWIFPFALGLLLFSLLEVVAWNFRKSVFTTFLRETVFRSLTTVGIVCYIFFWQKNFDSFIKFYATTYGIVALILFIELYRTGKIHLTFSVSRVTKKFIKKIIALAAFVYAGGVVSMCALFADTIIIAALKVDRQLAIFSLAAVITGLIQAPQRGVIASSLAVLSRAWKDKDLGLINRIYHRSSINLLLISLAIYALITLNYTNAITTFGLKEIYLQSFSVFLLLGLTRVIDMGTGVNGQIIATSTFWRFEFLSGVILLSLAIPLNYFLVKKYGIIGAGITNVAAYTVYNTIRITYLWKKFKMQPFSNKTVYAVLLAAVSFCISYFSSRNMTGVGAMFFSSILFIIPFAAGVIYLNLSPDLRPVWLTIQKRLGIKKGDEPSP